MYQGLDDARIDDVLTPCPMVAVTRDIIVRRLHQTGLIVLDGLVSRADVLALALSVMHIASHRDSDPDGLTTIASRSGESRPGFAGFSSAALAPHTERSGIPAPPRLILLVCAREAEAGGECLLTDGRRVHADLLNRQQDAVTGLSEPRTAFFGAADSAGGGHASQVFTTHPTGRVSVRLRLDGLARFSPIVEPYLPVLREAAIRHQLSLRLKAGQGYLLDNTRWLHARNSFTGRRLCWRALGDPKFPLPLGFAPAYHYRATATAGHEAQPPNADHSLDKPLEKINGWSIWPTTDGVHLATRDRPLDDREIHALTLTRSLYANSRDGLLEKIDVQNRLAADLTKEVRHGRSP